MSSTPRASPLALRVASAGRHLVMIGDKTLQVVDATPFVAGPALAAPPP